MFTLYRIGFCSVSKVAPVQREQELMFCCGAEIVPKRSQCEQKPYPLCNLQRSLLIWKDNLPIRGSVAISAPIKVFRLDSDRLKNLSDTERSTFNSGAEQYCSGAETALKAAFLVWTEALSDTLSATLRFTIRYSVNIALTSLRRFCNFPPNLSTLVSIMHTKRKTNCSLQRIITSQLSGKIWKKCSLGLPFGTLSSG